MVKFNKDKYKLYFVVNGQDRLYGTGHMRYIMELLDDYLYDCRMYGKDEVEFKVCKYEK